MTKVAVVQADSYDTQIVEYAPRGGQRSFSNYPSIGSH